MLKKLKSIPSILKNLTNHPLNKSRKTAAILRLISWQLKTLTTSLPITYNWIHGTKIKVHKNESGFTGNIYSGLHEFEDMMYLLHVTRKDDTFVDVGSNIGSYTILASGVIGAKTIAFEPSPTTYKKLIQNIKINSLNEKVSARNIGISNTCEPIHFTKNLNCTNHMVQNPNDYKSDEIIEIPVSTLDQELESESPSIIKIDVEGFEKNVIKGGLATLEKDSLHSVIMELNGLAERAGLSEEAILDKMNQLGFRRYEYDPFLRKLKAKSNIKGGNTIFCRDSEKARERIKTSRSFTIQNIEL